MGLLPTTISSTKSYGLTITNKVVYELVMQKYTKHIKQYERAQKTVTSIDKFYGNWLQDF